MLTALTPKQLWTGALVLLLMARSACGGVATNQFLVTTNSAWRYFKGLSEASTPTNGWREINFDDSGWQDGPAPFHFGTNAVGGDDDQLGGTTLSDMRSNYTCVFLRQAFVVPDTNHLLGLALNFYYDDGFAVWINGRAPRSPIGVSANLAYTNRATSALREANLLNRVDVSSALASLVNGTNILCLQAFNGHLTNDDFRIDVELMATNRDLFPPLIAGSTPAPGASVPELHQVTVQFDEPVTGVEADALLINGQPATSVAGTNATYTFFFPQPRFGQVTFSWDGNHGILDLAANRFQETAPGAAWTCSLLPTLAEVTPAPGAVLGSLTRMEMLFNQPVRGVDAGDLLINGVPAASAVGSGAGPYVFEFPQPPSGTVQIIWAAQNGIQDFQVPPNAFASSGWSYSLVSTDTLGRVIINEFLAANINTNTGLKDEFGELEDWIELYNPGTNAVNLLGWSLTDDRGLPGKWIFPATNLGPGQYLVVHASARDLTAVGGTNRLHTNFKLNVYGNYLGLFRPELPRVAASEFAPEYPEQRNDYSYGRNSTNGWNHCLPPTPGAANIDSYILGVVPPPHVSIERGLFEQPFSLVAGCSLSGATVRYTTDGSEPTASSGQVYTGPLRITNTTVLRLSAFAPNRLPSRTKTHTYIFPDQVLRQPNNPPGYPVGATVWTGYPSDYEMDPEITVTNAAYRDLVKPALLALPTLSVVMSIDHLFGSANGIYTHPEPPAAERYKWERPCSVEYVLTNGTTGFTIDCGIRIQGNASRTPQKTPKHPFRLMFRGAYGAGQLDYPLFPDSAVSSFDTLVLRADFNNSWVHWDPNQRLRGTKVRDAWAKESMRDMGWPASHSEPFHLYLNGIYWGVYDFGERVDAAWAASYFGGVPDDYDAIASKPTEAVDGDLQAYTTMTNVVRASNMSFATNYTRAGQHLEMPNFIDYMLLNFYGANVDWGFDGNWNAVRRRAPGETFKYVAWDGEQLVVQNGDNRTTSTDLPSGLHTNLVRSPEYRLAFADRAHMHLFNGGALSTNEVIQRWWNLARRVELPIVAESARWGDYRRDVHQYQNPPYYLYTRDEYWTPEIHRMATNYFPQRQATFLSQLRAVSLYPSHAAPAFNQHGGRVPRGFALAISATNTVYYTTDGSDPRVFGTGSVAPSALPYTNGVPLVLQATTFVKARALFGTNWSALNEATFTVEELGLPLRFTEFMYAPSGGSAYEYLELRNLGSAAVDLSQFKLDGVGYTIPQGTVIPAGGILVFASAVDANAFRVRYPDVSVAGWYPGALKDGGERIALLDRNLQTVTSVIYAPNGDWPAGAATGSALEIIDPNADPNDPANWRATPSGSPGGPNPSVPSADVVLNEIMAENLSAVTNGATLPDWVELLNRSASPIHLLGWSLSDDADSRKFVFPDVTLPAGEYLLVWCDADYAAPGLHAGFALNRGGESLFLSDALSNRVDAVSIGLQLPDYTVGRIGDTWRLGPPTPGAANLEASLAAPSSLLINEWLANALPGGPDWVEIHNTSASSPAALRGVYLSMSNSFFEIGSLSFVAPGGFVQLLADELPGPDHLGFRLPKEGASIGLYDETGAPLDRVTYGAQAQGVSQGRLPNGSAAIVTFPVTQSPGASNYVVTYTGPRLNEVMAWNESSVVGPFGNYPDWIELRNTNGAAFDLSGMSLSDSADKPGEWTFPIGTAIAANSHLLVWCDGSHPPTLSAGPILNAGFSLGRNDGGVYLFNALGQRLDAVEYGFQVADASMVRTDNGWVLASAPSPGAPNSTAAALGAATNLRINEWMAEPAAGPDWFELHNLDGLPVDLGGLYLTDMPTIAGLTGFQIAPLSFVAGRSRVLFKADGDPAQGRDHVNFSLDAQGETIRLYATPSDLIDAVDFGAQTVGVSTGRLPDGSSNVVTFPGSASPEESNYLPLTNVAINEVLAHTDPPLEDAIELANLTAQFIDLGGWYLSDAQTDLKRYRIPAGTVLPPHGFAVFYEYQFNTNGGLPPGFSLSSARGDELFLSEADTNDLLTGYRASAQFGASSNGVSLGRYVTSVGVDFVALSARTFGVDNPGSVVEFRGGTGLTNAYPAVGPVVINEVMYHPNSAAGAESADEEFIELHNVSGASASLYDFAHPTNRWKLAGGVDFDFPTGATLAVDDYLLVVPFDPAADAARLAAFRARYNVPANVAVLGPWSGKLDNAGESIELFRPDAPQTSPPDAGFVPFLMVDRIEYDDAHPWPTNAVDGGGASLQRISRQAYGNEPLNWRAAAPSAGRTNDPAALVPPVINLPPQDAAALVGASMLFSVLVDGTPPVAYQWQFNGVDLVGETNVTYLIPVVQTNAQGSYRVVVSNAAGTNVSRSATLRVLAPPIVISLSPLSQTVVAGETGSFAVVADGTLPLSYQWLHDNAALPGRTGPSLTLLGVGWANAGDYQVVISNVVGVVTSEVARLIVPVPPSITGEPLDQAVVEGGAATFALSATGDAPLNYRWFVNDNLIDGVDGPVLSLTNVQAGDQDNQYFAIVGNPAGYATSRVARLTVLLPPQISAQPQSQTVKVGESASLSVVAVGTPPLGYLWYADSNLIAGATSPALTLTNLQASDDGKSYFVVVTNQVGAIASAAAKLSVLAQPVLADLGWSDDGTAIRFIIQGQPGRTYVLDSAPSIVELTTGAPTSESLTVTNGQLIVVGTTTNAPQRFYRARLVQ